MVKVSLPTEQTEQAQFKISIIGLPGAGKTTQAKLLEFTTAMLHISSGDLVRQHLTDSYTREELSKGHLAPCEDAVRELVRKKAKEAQSYVLDGFPRMIDQIDQLNVPLDAVIHLQVPDTVAIKRLLDRKRPDDQIDIIESRIATYYKLTHPLISYFNRSNTVPVISIDGNRIRSIVWADIVNEIYKLKYGTSAREAEKASSD